MGFSAVLLAQFVGTKENALTHNFTWFELHRGPRRYDDVGFWFIRVAANPSLGQANLEDAEISQFHVIPLGQTFSDMLKGLLYDCECLLLIDADIVTDCYDHVAFCKICHKK